MARIFITGGCGFIGSHLAAWHLAQGDEVLVLDNLSSGSLQNLKDVENPQLLTLVNADILTWPELQDASIWAHRIYHFAAIAGTVNVLANPINVLKTNIQGCERLLEAMSLAKAKARVFIASSASVYGKGKPHAKTFKETDELVIPIEGHYLSTYAISKIAQESVALAYFHSHKIPLTLLRFFNIIGWGQSPAYGMVVPKFIKQALTHQPITIYGDGSQTRSFCHIQDVVTAIDCLARTEDSIGEIINIGNANLLSINELAALIVRLTQSHSKIEKIPFAKAYGSGYDDSPQRRPSLKKLYQLTRFKPTINIEDAIISCLPN